MRIWLPLATFCLALGPLLYYRPWEYSPYLVHWLGNHIPHGRQVGIALVMLALLLYLLRRVYLIFRASRLLRNLPSTERLELLATAVFGLAMVTAFASVDPTS